MTITRGTNLFYIGENHETAIAEITFSTGEGNTIVIEHTRVSETLKGQGVGVKLVNAVADMAREERRGIIPACPFAKKILTGSGEYADVLAR